MLARSGPAAPATVPTMGRDAQLDAREAAGAGGNTGAGAAVTAVVGVALVALGFAFALLEPVPRAEGVVFEVVNGSPGGVSAALWPIMQLGSVVAAVAVAVVCVAVWRRPRPALDVLVAGLGASSLAQVLKAIVERGRPAAYVADATVRLHGVDGWGFPSGHAAIAFAVATALAPWVGRGGRVALYVAATLVALARVTHGVHLPADVVGGAGLGLLCGLAARLLFDRTLGRSSPAPGVPPA